MLDVFARHDLRSRMNLVFTALFLVVILFFGGASRADVPSQPLVRFAAITLIAVTALQIGRNEWRLVRLPAWFLLAVAAVIAVQLIPLPPDMWASLPGRSLYSEALSAAGITPVWRPLSLTPDLTLNSLLSVLPALAVVLALATIDSSLHRMLIPVILLGVVFTSAVGLLQISGGLPYFYRITNEGFAVGVFSNRNHQAMFLATSFPLLACWTALPHSDPEYRKLRNWLALCVAAAIFPLLLVIGSRGGLLIGAVSALASLVLVMGRRQRFRAIEQTGIGRLLPLLPLIIGLAAVGASLFFARDVAFRRLLEGEQAETRIGFLPIFGDMIRDSFPFGFGFGSFDTIFRSYEPHESLRSAYLNHAHNDVAELLIEAGVAGLALAVAFIVWLIVWMWRLWRRPADGTAQILGRTGSIIVLLILMGSVVDYPLRTPIFATLMAIACIWMCLSDADERDSRRRKDRVGTPDGIG